MEGENINAMLLRQRTTELPFTARIEGSRLILNPKLAEEHEPVSVEFAQTQWYRVNLFNEAGIPAMPFRLDVRPKLEKD